MPDVTKTVLVHYSAQQMYELVDGVEEYPKFLPWCGGGSVSHRDEHLTRATIQINYKGIKQSFTTENRKDPGREMWIKLVEGPFRTLDGNWRFLPLTDDSCKIEFSLRYEFASRLLEKLIGPVFNFVANSMVEAFVKRADQRYGSP